MASQAVCPKCFIEGSAVLDEEHHRQYERQYDALLAVVSPRVLMFTALASLRRGALHLCPGIEIKTCMHHR